MLVITGSCPVWTGFHVFVYKFFLCVTKMAVILKAVEKKSTRERERERAGSGRKQFKVFKKSFA